MFPNGEPASRGDMPGPAAAAPPPLILLVVDSLESVLPMAELVGCFERKLRGGILSPDDVVLLVGGLPLLVLHPLEERFLICSLDKAGDGGALRGGPPTGLSKALPAGDCSSPADMVS